MAVAVKIELTQSMVAEQEIPTVYPYKQDGYTKFYIPGMTPEQFVMAGFGIGWDNDNNTVTEKSDKKIIKHCRKEPGASRVYAIRFHNTTSNHPVCIVVKPLEQGIEITDLSWCHTGLILTILNAVAIFQETFLDWSLVDHTEYIDGATTDDIITPLLIE